MLLDEIKEKIEQANTYGQMHSICYTRMRRMANGSSRVIFELDENHVVKLAINHAGIFQNDKERLVCKNRKHKHIANVVDYVPSGRIIISEKADITTDIDPIVIRDYSMVFDSLSRFSKELGTYIYSQRIHDFAGIYRNKLLEENKNILSTEIGSFMFNMADEFDIVFGDLFRKDSWGVIDDKIVILDYGLTREVFNIFYHPGHFIFDEYKYQGPLDIKHIREYFEIKD